MIDKILLGMCVALKRAVYSVCRSSSSLTAESVQSPALSLQGVDNVHGSDGLPLGMLGVCDGITDDVLQENLQDTTGLFVDQS